MALGKYSELHKVKIRNLISFAAFNSKTMSVTRLKRKNRKDKAIAARRRQTLKIQGFKPVAKGIDIEKIKEEFKAKKASKKA